MATTTIRPAVEIEAVGNGNGPRVLLLPGLGARGSGYRRLAEALAPHSSPLFVEYPQGPHAKSTPAELASAVLDAVGPVDAIVGSSYGGLVGAHLAASGATRALALIGSFTSREQLGWRGQLIGLMGVVAEAGRPGRVAACVASRAVIAVPDVPHLVPTTGVERRSTWHRSIAAYRGSPPPSLRQRDIRCLCIHGARDLIVPMGVLTRVLDALPPGSPVHVLRDAGHVPYFTHVAECAAILKPWLSSLGRKSSLRQAQGDPSTSSG